MQQKLIVCHLKARIINKKMHLHVNYTLALTKNRKRLHNPCLRFAKGIKYLDEGDTG